MDVDELKNLLKKFHLKPNFTYGQNFLINDLVLQEIVDAAEISAADAVLEIGPGIGNLTRLLCQRAGFVLSVEKDPSFFPVLKSIKKDYAKNFRFEIADILAFDFLKVLAQLRGGFGSYKVVANIPYYITGKILQMLLAAKSKPESITLLVQKEVAQTVTAEAGSLSVLAISVQLFGRPKIVQLVPAKSFYPAPKVDSAVLQIKPDPQLRYDIPDEKNFFQIVKACFAGKRKQIHNTLENNLRLPKIAVEKILSELNISMQARPQQLSLEQWVELAKKISALPQG